MTAYDTLKKIFVDDLKVPDDLIAPDATLKDIEFDSLALVELTVILERDLGVEIHEDELKELATLGDMARLVDERVAQAHA
ncbi:acyl carrier protein [Streptomyces sp. SID12501]|uniref:Acyl carrier protein n=1 Tax=Streptomyces sp. SID12501 TaxID=2706042 RepID=A0A6B3C4Q8_9ACTN|nr:acyl carrier protein [Streptomyces sp. SID12501]NEC91723.1 acyl carrier protein [Streptomyces sp. SID12501]